jgi:uncharacterized membrane protein YbhN (UPF0104 family)
MPVAAQVRSVAGSSIIRLVLAFAVVAAVVVLAVVHRSAVLAGGDSLADGDKEWLVPAGLATVAVWVAGAVTQFGSMPTRAPLARLLAVQVAASFANHVSPAGSGGIGVNIRFLQRHGLSSGAASGAVGLNSLAGLVTHVLLLLAAVAISPTLAHSIHAPASWWSLAAGAAYQAGWVLLLVAGVLAVALARKSWRARLGGYLVPFLREVRRLGPVLRHPGRAAALWLGSLSTPLLHAVILFAVLRSLGVSMTVGAAVVVYLVVSSLAALVPSPGGLGAFDVMLLAGLEAVGVLSSVAFGAVLGYRLITVWLPLLPGAVALAVLVRRRII